MNFAVVNLGCKVNRVESDAAAAVLMGCGGVATREADADLIVVNTCTVTGEAEKKTRKAVRHALRASENARVVVTGCAAALDAATYEGMDERVEAVPKAELEAHLREIAAGDAGRGEGGVRAAPFPVAARLSSQVEEAFAAPLPLGTGFRTRVGVKVQDGCNNACTYCIVHVARGRAVSRPVAAVASECRALAASGVKEIVLTGINLGSYRDSGRGAARAAGLTDLLRRLLDETARLHAPDEPPCRFRVSSIEPCDVDEAFIDLLAASEGRVCRHLHLPLQSGSAKVLREMARPYHAERFVALVDRVRAQVPRIALSTDIIVGFPGETDAEFQETLDVARRCGFSKIHVFPYSRRAGTPAAARTDQVPPAVKAARAAALRMLGDELRAVDRADRAGTVEHALVEAGGIAMTESYFEVPAPTGAPVGALCPVEL